MNVIFLGTPSFAVPCLKKLIESNHKVLAVVCQPDKKAGRRQQVVCPPVKLLAEANGIPVLQYSKIRFEGVEDLKKLNPDIMISCAFGQILSQEIIDIPKHGIINVHGSILPKYRGAAPIQQAIIDGETETGITIMQTEAGIDTGDILSVAKTPIYPNETAGELFERLSVIGADLLLDTLDKMEKGQIVSKKQDDSQATHVSMIKKEDALIDWSMSANCIHNKIRGMNPWPIAFTHLNGKLLKIYLSKPVVYQSSQGEVGQVVLCDVKNPLIIKCGQGYLSIENLQLEGGKQLSAHDFILGRKIKAGDILQ